VKLPDALKVLSNILQGYTTLGTEAQHSDILAALNAAQEEVAEELNTFFMETTGLVGSGDADGDIGTGVFNPPPLTETSSVLGLPSYASMAIIYYAAGILAERQGEFQKDGDKDIGRLRAFYQAELAHAKRAAAIRFHRHPRAVEDGVDPDRFTRCQF
jgi:hypothetical protein